MPKRSKKDSKKGKGACGTPNCEQPKAPDRFLCEKHAGLMNKVRQELEDDPKLLYNQRSDNPNRELQEPGKKRAPRRPVCCLIGCFELRVPPSPFCDAHADTRLDD